MTEPVTLHHGDCLAVLDALPENHFDAVVTDPPYHLTSIVKRFGADGAAPAQPGSDGLFQRGSRGFMGQTWDGGDIAFRPETWAKVLRVLKPGGHLVAFNHSKTFHHMATAIELAGFEARDSILSLYDTGAAWAQFIDSLAPSQLDALARALATADAPLLAWLYGTGFPKSHDVSKAIDKALGAEFSASPASGCGFMGADGPGGWNPTKNKLTRVGEMTPEAAAWEGWGTALKPGFEPIVLARKPLAETSIARQVLATGTGGLNIDEARASHGEACRMMMPSQANIDNPSEKHRQAGRRKPVLELKPAGRWPANVVTDGSPEVIARFPVDGDATTSRFFYSAKADDKDRAGSDHPTVKPQALMRWLVRLTTARGGLVLDPFGGSGSTGWAAHAEGRRAVLIERDDKFAAHIAARIARLDAPPPPADPAKPAPQPDLFGG